MERGQLLTRFTIGFNINLHHSLISTSPYITILYTIQSKMASTLKIYNFVKLFESENDSDVEFKIFNDVEAETKSVKGHQFLLGLLSPVLKKQFLYMKENVIEIRGPSFNSFKTFIKFLYSGEEKDIKGINDLEVLFEIYGLVDTYQVRGIKNIIKNSVEVPKPKLVYCLELLQKYQSEFMFEDLVKIVQEKCFITLHQGFTCSEIPPTDLIRIWGIMKCDLVFWGLINGLDKKFEDAVQRIKQANCHEQEKKQETGQDYSDEESWDLESVHIDPKRIKLQVYPL